MDFSKTKRSKRNKHSHSEDRSGSERLHFYKIPPIETISLFEFEEYAVERLKVLKIVETAAVKHIKNSKKYITNLTTELRKTFIKDLTKTTSGQENEEDEKELAARRKDHISHFILRLAYCRSEELKRWFLTQEVDLFKYRFKYRFHITKDQDIRNLLEVNNLNYESISNDERSSLLEQLADMRNVSAATIQTMEYYKVAFTECLDLVQKRRVYLQRGFAYVPYEDMLSILTSVYRTHLSQALAVTAQAVPHLEEDDRLMPMLCGLSKRYLGSDYNVKKTNVGQITSDMIDMLSKKSFPLCMQQLHGAIRQNHHLKHGGRMQYGLFLKGIGLSLEEAMKFWRSEFTKLMDVDKFDKQYSYTIRHNYGKEGKRTDYTPYSCMKIIMSNSPGAGDHHGCPFRHSDADLLKQKIKGQGIGSEYYDKIVEYLSKGHYQLACTRYFEAIHKLPLDTHNAFGHPNEYFEESQKERNGLNQSKDQLSGTPKTPRTKPGLSQATPKSQQSTQSSTQSSTTTSTQPLSGVEMMDDDLDLLAVEQSMQTST